MFGHIGRQRLPSLLGMRLMSRSQALFGIVLLEEPVIVLVVSRSSMQPFQVTEVVVEPLARLAISPRLAWLSEVPMTPSSSVAMLTALPSLYWLVSSVA